VLPNLRQWGVAICMLTDIQYRLAVPGALADGNVSQNIPSLMSQPGIPIF